MRMTEKEIEYQKLVSDYQVARRDPKQKKRARELFEVTQEMERSGAISDRVIMGMKYL